VKIRLRRMGKKKQPIYKIVAANSTSPRDGKFIEAIGLYNPLTNPYTVDVKENVLFKWLKRGATPTDTVLSLLKNKGLLLKWNLIRKNTDDATIALEMEKWQMLSVEKMRRGTEKKMRRKLARKKKATAEEPKQESVSTAEVVI
ncbi:MAG: 30S ribosomal protein S16, partial [Bacteroidetes bacterium]|nr:30S ribosomal protein S16 [Bacteroidota bacterium]MBU1423168.1 30S ribosomal protein S16 [Bacteroidota bacterium]